MNRLKEILEKYNRWQPLNIYIERIEGYRNSDFPFCVESAKSLLESIAKEICNHKNEPIPAGISINRVLGLSFRCLDYPKDGTFTQISTAISNIGQQMGDFRNKIGTTSHGKTLDELRNRKEIVDSFTSDFLLFSTELVSCFLIEAFEADNPLAIVEPEIKFEDSKDFNQSVDEQYGEFKIGNLSFLASFILFSLDPQAYKTALSEFNLTKDETNN